MRDCCLNLWLATRFFFSYKVASWLEKATPDQCRWRYAREQHAPDLGSGSKVGQCCCKRLGFPVSFRGVSVGHKRWRFFNKNRNVKKTELTKTNSKLIAYTLLKIKQIVANMQKKQTIWLSFPSCCFWAFQIAPITLLPFFPARKLELNLGVGSVWPHLSGCEKTCKLLKQRNFQEDGLSMDFSEWLVQFGIFQNSMIN